jgi:addiction module HigA family antidote
VSQSDWSVHPGEILREKLAEMGMSGSEAANRMDVTPPFVSMLLNGRKGVGVGVALKLEALTGISAEMWLGLAARHALYLARQRTGQAFDVPAPSEDIVAHELTP